MTSIHVIDLLNDIINIYQQCSIDLSIQTTFGNNGEKPSKLQYIESINIQKCVLNEQKQICIPRLNWYYSDYEFCSEMDQNLDPPEWWGYFKIDELFDRYEPIRQLIGISCIFRCISLPFQLSFMF